MSVFDRLKFWKKEDEFDFDKIATKDIHGETAIHDELGLEEKGFEEKPLFPPAQVPAEEPAIAKPAYQPPATANRDLELINSKLDTLKAMLNSMEARLANLEKAAGIEKKERLW